MARHQAGHTILELLVGAALGLTLLALIYFFYSMQNDIFQKEEKKLPAEASARTAMNAMLRDIRMTGFRRGASTIDPIAGTAYSATFRRYTTVDKITTTLDTTFFVNNQMLMRTGPTGTRTITGNVDKLEFTFRDYAGNIKTTWNEVRRIDVTLKTKVRNPGPAFGAYSSYSLTESVMPPNLAP